MACWWLEDYPACIDAREQAYQLYCAREQSTAAARVAVRLFDDYIEVRGETATAEEWLSRAERLLQGLEPVPEHALLAYTRGHVALDFHHDPIPARRLAAEAAEVARKAGERELEMLGLALEGLALVNQGQIAAGMGLLDESTAAALAGEVIDPFTIGTVCRYLIRACEQVHDYDRAAQWCVRSLEFCERWQFTRLSSSCRLQYAALLTLQGNWEEAESELEAVRHRIETTQPQLLPVALVQLADLRRRQGRWEEADRLLSQSGPHLQAVLGRAALALDRGESATAAELAEDYLWRIPAENQTERAAGLELLSLAKVQEEALDQARVALEQLWEIAAKAGSEPLRAAAAFARGCLLAAEHDHAGACRLLEQCATSLDRNRIPLEAGRAKFQLGKTLLSLGRREPAALALRSAHEVFESLSAARWAGATRLLLQEIRPHRKSGGFSSGKYRLDGRELEVLELVARGLDDQEIAFQLGLSEHMVGQHIDNILSKTGFPSRAAAVAQAARQGLL